MYLTDKPSHGRPVLYPAPHKPLSYHTMGHGYNTRRIPGGEKRLAMTSPSSSLPLFPPPLPPPLPLLTCVGYCMGAQYRTLRGTAARQSHCRGWGPGLDQRETLAQEGPWLGWQTPGPDGRGHEGGAWGGGERLSQLVHKKHRLVLPRHRGLQLQGGNGESGDAHLSTLANKAFLQAAH